MKYDFEQSEEKGTLVFYGNLDDSECEEVRRILLNALNQCENLVVSFNRVTGFSVKCMDIMRRLYTDTPYNKKLSFIGDWNERFIDLGYHTGDKYRLCRKKI